MWELTPNHESSPDNLPNSIFRSSEKEFGKTREKYLKADMERVSLLRKELGVEGKKVIGISWKSFKSLNTSKKFL